MSAPGVIVAAPASGSGKTTVTLALLRALRGRGLDVGSFKVGPDYIDPVFHARASGLICPNLDSWAMRIETLSGLGDRIARDVDLVIGEGVMGLFDGALVGQGSTADLASLFDLPVVLVVDAGRMVASAAALVEGFIRHREDVDVAGIIFNRVASDIHADLLQRACNDHFAQPVIGCLPTDKKLELPSRHLGLVQADEKPTLESFLDQAAGIIAEHLDLDQFQHLARPFGLGLYGPAPCPLRPLGQRIAVASDLAFAFAYPAVLEGWRQAGAEVTTFSPLADEAPSEDADAVYLPGGYPELHADRLAANANFLGGLVRAAARSSFVYGECGGFMVLGEGLIDKDGKVHAMAGLLPVTTSFEKPKRHLGYRSLKLQQACPLGSAGTTFRGHEFHYASIVEPSGGSIDLGDARPLYAAKDARGGDKGEHGLARGPVAGSFMHLIDRVAEPSDGDFRTTGPLRVVRD
ncbi:MAG: cobyrinate a,c-diamide synthase [Geminicoccaceae bacterium]